MKKYTREEIIAELAQNVSVSWKSYGSWEIKSYIGQRETYRYCANHYVEVSEITHNEEDKTGIFDGEIYNPQNFDDWFLEVFSYEFPEDDEREYYNDEELQEKFKEYCENVWSDSANEDNYESVEKREIRLAERLFDDLIEDDRVIECSNGNIVVLKELEAEFLCNNNGWRADLYEGKIDDFAEAFEEWEVKNA